MSGDFRRDFGLGRFFLWRPAARTEGRPGPIPITLEAAPKVRGFDDDFDGWVASNACPKRDSTLELVPNNKVYDAPGAVL